MTKIIGFEYLQRIVLSNTEPAPSKPHRSFLLDDWAWLSPLLEEMVTLAAREAARILIVILPINREQDS